MKPFFIIILILLALCNSKIAVAQSIDSNSILQAIVADSGLPASNFEAYSSRLATTLSSLSPESLNRVFEGSASVAPGDNDDEDDDEQEDETPFELTEAYQSALAARQEAYDRYQDALALVDLAEQALEAVLNDEDGLRDDGIPRNYGEALDAAEEALEAAEDAAEDAEDEYDDAVEAFDQFVEDAAADDDDDDD